MKMSIVISAVIALLTPLRGNCSELPDKIFFQSSQIDDCRKESSYKNGYCSSWGQSLRDNYYLPLRKEPVDPFLAESGAYASEVTQMLKGETSHLDPTFFYLPQVIKNFTVKDIPVVIENSDHSYTFNIRVLENPKLRLVLFSFYDNGDWDPTSSDEIGLVPLEIMRALQQYIPIDSMMCCSIGGITFEALKYASDDFLPRTIIWNRALTSTWKAGLSQFSSPLNYFLYWATSYFKLHADPEKSLADFCQWADHKRVVVIQATNDFYFSGDSALGPSFFERMRGANVELYEGKFLIPLLNPRAHHDCRLDMIINNHDFGTSTEHFLPMGKYESLPDCLVRNLFMPENGHTCFIIGGNRHSMDSILYLQALPLLSSYCKLNS